MGLFDKGEKEVSRKEFWEAVRGYKGTIPHTGSERFNPLQKRKLAKRAISPYGTEGSKIQPQEVRRMFKKLDSERKGFEKEAGRLKKEGDLKGAKGLTKEAQSLRKEMQFLGRVVGGKYGKKWERRKYW